MKHGRRQRSLAALGCAALHVTATLTGPAASADTSATPIVPGNASDPSAVGCYDEASGAAGICLCTSQDMGNAADAYPGNPYPMNETNCWNA